MTGRTFDHLNVGDTNRFPKTVTDADIYLFAGVTGDLKPAHIDKGYARGTFFKTRIAQRMLSAGFVSAVIGARLPGPGTVYVRQIFFGVAITIRAASTSFRSSPNPPWSSTA